MLSFLLNEHNPRVVLLGGKAIFLEHDNHSFVYTRINFFKHPNS